MRKLYLLLLSISLFTACSDSDDVADAPDAEQAQQQQPGLKNGGYVDGIHFNPDSVALEALVNYYEVEINSICSTTLIRLIEKDKTIQGRTKNQNLLTFELTKEKQDSLKHYGITPDMVSGSDVSKPVFLIGATKGTTRYELAKINIKNYREAYPVLFAKGRQIFMEDRRPKLANLTVTAQTTKSLEYSAEFSFADEQSTYVYFTARSERQNLQIVLNKSDD